MAYNLLLNVRYAHAANPPSCHLAVGYRIRQTSEKSRVQAGVGLVIKEA